MVRVGFAVLSAYFIIEETKTYIEKFWRSSNPAGVFIRL